MNLEMIVLPSSSGPAHRTLGDTYRPTSEQVYDQPKGDAGSLFSLDKMVEIIQKARTDSRVISWARKQLAEAGFPKTSRKRAEAIFEALRKQVGWIPDPADAEHMSAPHLVLGDGVDLGYFRGGDCDDLTIALLTAYISVAQSVGVKAAVVGQSYSSDKAIMHVLGAVWDEDEKQWFYLDPSSDFEPGRCLTPFTRERAIEVPSGKLLCDAASCLSGPNAARPIPPTEGVFVGLAGLPGETWEPITFASADSPNPIAHMLSANPDTPEEGLADGLIGLAKQLSELSNDLLVAKNLLVVATEKSGGQLIDGIHWTVELEQLFADTMAAGKEAVTYLTEAATGKRTIEITSTGDTLIQSLPEDLVQIITKDVTVSPGLVFQVFQRVNLATGAPMGLGALPNRTERRAMEAIAKSDGTVRSLGVAPAVIIAAIVGASIMAVGAVYAVTRTMQILHATIRQALCMYGAKLAADCATSKNCTSEVFKIIDKSCEIGLTATKNEGDPNADPWTGTLKTALWISGGVLVALGLYKAAKEVKPEAFRKNPSPVKTKSAPWKKPKKATCQCGSTDASWHGDPMGLRVYCCDTCWTKKHRKWGDPRLPPHVRAPHLPAAGIQGAISTQPWRTTAYHADARRRIGNQKAPCADREESGR